MSGDQEELDERAHDEAYRAPATDQLTAVTYEDLKRRGQMWVLLLMAGQVAFGVGKFFELSDMPGIPGVAEDLDTSVRRWLTAATVMLIGAQLLLLFGVYRGKRWARVLLLVWSGFSILGSVPALTAGRHLDLLNLLKLSHAAGAFGILLAAPSVRALVRGWAPGL